MALPRVTIYADGACRKNPGTRWLGVLIYQGRQRCSRSRAPNTTNNRMELIAAIEALNALKRPCAVELFTDSQYLRQGIQSWLPHWKTRGFVTMDGQPVKNQDLWQKLEHTAGRTKLNGSGSGVTRGIP